VESPQWPGALPEGGLKGHSRCGVLGVAPNAPKPDEVPSGMRGNENEAMTWELNPFQWLSLKEHGGWSSKLSRRFQP